MLDTLITSRTRIKLLLKFFLNTSSETYLRNLEHEFGESSNGIRVELNRLEEAGLLKSSSKGNRKYFKANIFHPLFPDIHNIILKHIGIDKIIEDVIEKLGKLKCVYLLGDFASGKDSFSIDLAFVGEDINVEYLNRLIAKVEKLIHRNVKYIIFDELEIGTFLKDKSQKEYLLVWEE
jgi:hypothetical protein